MYQLAEDLHRRPFVSSGVKRETCLRRSTYTIRHLLNVYDTLSVAPAVMSSPGEVFGIVPLVLSGKYLNGMHRSAERTRQKHKRARLLIRAAEAKICCIRGPLYDILLWKSYMRAPSLHIATHICWHSCRHTKTWSCCICNINTLPSCLRVGQSTAQHTSGSLSSTASAIELLSGFIDLAVPIGFLEQWLQPQ